MTKPGEDYERLTKAIFQAILDQSEVTNVLVQHDVSLKGTTASHQVDVYWEYEIAGIKYRTVIQTKDWDKRVDQGELIKFKGVLDDLPGQPRGVFVARTGYQRGAETFAAGHRIALFVLSEYVTPAIRLRSNGGFASVRILKEGVSKWGLAVEFQVFEPHFTKIQFALDPEWVLQEEISPEFLKPLLPQTPNTIGLYNAAQEEYSTLAKLERQAIERMTEDRVTEKDVECPLAIPSFVKFEGRPLLRVLSVSFHARIEKLEPIRSYMRPKDATDFILSQIGESAKYLCRLSPDSIPGEATLGKLDVGEASGFIKGPDPADGAR